MVVDLLTAIGIGGVSGVSSGALLMFVLKSLEKRISRAELRDQQLEDEIKRNKALMFKELKNQEDCWESELKKVQGQLTKTNTNLDKVITVMQMQATASGHPELVAILKGD